MQDEMEIYPYMPADTDADTDAIDGDTTAYKEIAAAYEQVLMLPPLTPPMTVVPLEARHTRTFPNDEEPGSELQLEESYPPQGDVTQEIPPRPRRPPKTHSLPSPISNEDPPSTPKTPEDPLTMYRYPTRMADKVALLSVMRITAMRARMKNPVAS